MGSLTVRYLRKLKGRWYWLPSKAARDAGLASEALGADLATAVARAEELNALLDAIRNPEPANVEAPGTMAWLSKKFRQSTWYTELAPKTQWEADRHIEIILAAPIGQHPVRSIKRSHCRTFHDKRAEKYGRDQANRSVKWLRRLFTFAIEKDLRNDNPAAGMGLRSNPPRRETWTPAEVEAFVNTALKLDMPHIALAVRLGYDTGQRLGDILAVCWNDYDGEGIEFRQGKTGTQIWNPVSTEARRMIADTPRRAIQIIVGPRRNRPLSTELFGRFYRRVRAAAEMRPHLTFHDLRRTAATEVSTGGGVVEHITGHRPGSSALRHYVVPNKDAARAAHSARKGSNRERDS